MLTADDFPSPAQCALGRVLFQGGKIDELSKMINDSGLTNKLTAKQLEHLSRKVARK